MGGTELGHRGAIVSTNNKKKSNIFMTSLPVIANGKQKAARYCLYCNFIFVEEK